MELFLTDFVSLLNFKKDFAVRATSALTNAPLVNIGPSAYVSPGSFNPGGIQFVLAFGNISSASGFTSGEIGYMGFRFNPSGSLVLYGWAEVILTDGGDSGTFEVVRWAYDNTGANIQTPVPEPATTAMGLGALALGAAGLRRWRKAN